MLTGYNTDIKHEGVVYHVQTEDGGTENPVIVSLIYRGGRILASKKTSYAHLIGNEDMISRLRDLLEQQHRAMIKAILTGTPVPEPGPDQPPTESREPAPPANPAPPQAGTAPPGVPAPSAKPPLEIPPESATDATTNRAAEKNLDQVILEYLASEIDKD